MEATFNLISEYNTVTCYYNTDTEKFLLHKAIDEFQIEMEDFSLWAMFPYNDGVIAEIKNEADYYAAYGNENEKLSSILEAKVWIDEKRKLFFKKQPLTRKQKELKKLFGVEWLLITPEGFTKRLSSPELASYTIQPNSTLIQIKVLSVDFV